MPVVKWKSWKKFEDKKASKQVKKEKKAMSKMKKIIMPACILLVGIVAVFGLYVFKQKIDISNQKSAEKDRQILNEKIDLFHSMNIKLYGTDINFDEEYIQYEKVDKIDSNVFDGEQFYSYLIINNLEGEAPVTDEEIKLLVKMIDEDEHCNMVYLGKDIKRFVEIGILDKEEYDDDDYAICYYGYTGEHDVQSIGIWTKEDEAEKEEHPERLGDSLAFNIRHLARDYKESPQYPLKEEE